MKRLAGCLKEACLLLLPNAGGIYDTNKMVGELKEGGGGL